MAGRVVELLTSRAVASSMVTDEAQALLSISKLKNTKLNFAAFDDLHSQLPFTYNKTTFNIELNATALAKTEDLFRAGEINKMLKAHKIMDELSASDELYIKSLFGSVTPDVAIKEIENRAVKFESQFKELKVDSCDKLNVNGKNMLEKLKTKLLALKKPIIYGVLGFVVIEGGILTDEAINKAIKRLNGCFMVTQVGNDISSCKIKNRSCLMDDDDTTPQCELRFRYWNMHVILHDALKNNVRFIKAIVAAALHKYLTSSTIDEILSNDDEVSQLERAIYTEVALAEANPCNISDEYKNAPCLACCESADHKSFTYLYLPDRTRLNVNTKLVCKSNATVYDLICDLSHTVNTIFDLEGKFKYAKYVIIGFLCFVFILFVLSFLKR